MTLKVAIATGCERYYEDPKSRAIIRNTVNVCGQKDYRTGINSE